MPEQPQPIAGSASGSANASPRPSRAVGRTIEMPQPTQDQKDYLEEIKRSTGRYDPNVIVGGPRPKA